MQNSFNFYTDPSHGWLKVPKKLIAELGLTQKISKCSYQRGENAYLEEDADAPLFLKALEAKTKKPAKITEFTGDKQSKIRNYEPFGA